MRVWLFALVACGCGRVGFDARADASLDGATGPSACNQLTDVYDDFDSVDLDLWGGSYTDPGTSLQAIGGDLVLTPASSSTASAYCGLQTYRHYDARGHRVVAEVAQVGTNGALSGIQLRAGDNQILLYEANGQLDAAYVTSTYTTVQERPYSPSSDRFWAITESNGTVAWQTSSDGSTFTSFAEAPTPFDVSFARVQLFAGTDASVAAPGSFRVARVGERPPAVAVCSSDSFSDTFDGIALDAKWLNTYDEPCCTAAPTSGRLVVTTDGSPGYSFVRSAAGYDLRGRHVDVELVQSSTQAGITQSLVVRRDPMNSLSLVSSTIGFNAYEVVGGAPTSHVSSRMPGERYLRIRESAGTYTAEVSTDRQAWRAVYTGPVTFAFDNVTFELETGNPGDAVNPDTILWDNFNAL